MSLKLFILCYYFQYGSASGAICKRITKWVRKFSKEELEFFALHYPTEPWKRLADICHFNPNKVITYCFNWCTIEPALLVHTLWKVTCMRTNCFTKPYGRNHTCFARPQLLHLLRLSFFRWIITYRRDTLFAHFFGTSWWSCFAWCFGINLYKCNFLRLLITTAVLANFKGTANISWWQQFKCKNLPIQRRKEAFERSIFPFFDDV